MKDTEQNKDILRVQNFQQIRDELKMIDQQKE